MESSVHVICYHRVLADEGRRENTPYFLRGTAVSQTVFRQHIRDIRERFECLDERHALAVLQGAVQLQRPGCWITFDDAYVDVVDSVAPLLDEAGMRATVFVSTATLDATALPADRWYATLTTAKRRRGMVLDPEPWQFDLDDPSAFHRFIDGPEKRLFLRSTQKQQEEALRRLAAALDADSTVPGGRVYLNVADIRDLSQRGWSIGSHTMSHPILTELAEEKQRHELEGSRARLAKLLGNSPRTFAYPDGAWNKAIASQVRKAGYTGAVTIDPAVAHPGDNLFAIPRVLARNDPCFVTQL